MMIELISYIGTGLMVVWWYLFYRSVIIFLKINASKEGRVYRNFFYEWINLKHEVWFKLGYIDIFPFSYFLYKIDHSNYESDSEDVKIMYQKKFKLEKILWFMTALGMLCIPLVEYIIPHIIPRCR